MTARFGAPAGPHVAHRRAGGKRISVAVVVWVLLALSGTPAWSADSVPNTVLEALQHASIPLSSTSFFVAAVDGGGPILSINEDRPMNPASTMKLVTTYTALELLGPAYTWKTQVLTNGKLSDGVLRGDLILRGSGDPKLVVEDVWLMLRQLRARGVREIRGDIVLDRSLFDSASYDASRFDGEPFRPYNVGPDALLLNFKSVTLTFVPDVEAHVVRVVSEPVLEGEQIGPVRWLDGPCGDWVAKLAGDFSNSDQLSFAGGFAASCGEKNLGVSVYTPTQYASGLLRSLWSELGGTLKGQVRDGTYQPTDRLLFVHDSPSLAEVVYDINKYSNNVMARQLFLTLAAEVLKISAQPERSERVVKSFLANKGLAMPELVLENGAGLSRVERISAASMGALLETAWSSPVMPELMASLPVVGSDGTMRRRMKSQGVTGQAHLKTGSLADVRAIAGYVLAASGRRYVVVSFINHPAAPGAATVHDALIQWVYDHG